MEKGFKEFSSEETKEISRVQALTKKYVRRMIATILLGKKDISGLITELCSEIFDSSEIQMTVTGQENIPQENVIYACNHATHSEKYFVLPKNLIFNYAIPYYLLETARRISQLSETESQILFSADNSLMKYIVEAGGQIPVERKNYRMTPEKRELLNQEVKRVLESGKNILLCPEGRFFGEKENNEVINIGPMGKGIFHIAKDNDTQVVPVILKGFCRSGSTKFSIDIQPPLTVGVEETAAEFAERIRQVFIEKGFSPVEKI